MCETFTKNCETRQNRSKIALFGQFSIKRQSDRERRKRATFGRADEKGSTVSDIFALKTHTALKSVKKISQKGEL